MKERLLSSLIQALLSLLSPELLKKFADMVLDFAEDFVLGTKSQIDDMLVLPVCEAIRRAFGIEDNDDVDSDNSSTD